MKKETPATKYIYLIAFIIVSGIFLRVFLLAQESLWLDEVSSVRISKNEIDKVFSVVSQNDVHPPFYYSLLHYWMKIFGHTEAAVRSLSVVFSVFSIFLFYRFLSALFSREEGLWGSFLLSISVFHVYYAQEARSYALFSLLGLASFFFFVKLFRNGRSRGEMIAYVIFTILFFYTHVYSLFYLLLQQLVFLFYSFLQFDQRKRLGLKEWGILQLIIILGISPWLPTLFSHVSEVNEGYWIAKPDFISLVRTFVTFGGSKYLFLLFILVAGIYLFIHLSKSVFFRRRFSILPFSKASLFLWALLLLPPLFAFVVSLVSTPIYLTRPLILSSFSFFGILAVSLIGIRKHFPNIAKLLFVSICVVSLYHFIPYYSKPQKEQWREATYFIEEKAQPGDMVIFHAWFCSGPFEYYRSRDRDDLRIMGFPNNKIAIEAQDTITLKSIVDNERGIWLVLSHSRDKNGLIVSTLKENSFSLSGQKDFLGIQVFHFKKATH